MMPTHLDAAAPGAVNADGREETVNMPHDPRSHPTTPAQAHGFTRVRYADGGAGGA